MKQHSLLLLTLAAALGGIFAAYLRPEFMLTLANQLWACF